MVVGALDSADGLVEAQRIDDAVAHESVDLDALIVGGEHLLFRTLQVKDTIVQENDRLDEGYLEMQAGIGDEPASGNRLAEAQHKRLFRLQHDEGGAGENDQDDDSDADQNEALSIEDQFAVGDAGHVERF